MSAGSLSAGGARGRPRKAAVRRRPEGRSWLRLLRGDGAARFMRLLVAVFIVLLLLLQFRLWFGDGGVNEMLRLKQEVATQQQENEALRERNEALDAEVIDLKQGKAAVEERARRELGMIRRDETFYQAIGE